MKLVYIRWIDSSGTTGIWNSPEQILNSSSSLHCVSVGWVLGEDKQSITFVAHLSKTGTAGGDLTIPKRAILSMKEIKGYRESL